MAGQDVGGGGFEPHGRTAQVVVEPGLPLSRLARRHVDDLAVLLDRLDERRRDGAASADEHQHRRLEGGLDHLDEPRRVGREEPPRLTHHDDALVDEERRRQARIDDRSHIEIVAGAATDLLDHEGVVAVTDDVGQQRSHLLGHQGGVVPLDEIGRLVTRRGHWASLIAARASRARHVPRTSCTRRMRQPQATPRAAAPMEASRRSVSSRSSTLPRKVLLEAERSKG